MFDARLRRAKDGLAAPLAARLAGRVAPNALTLAGGAVGAAAALAAWRGAYGAALALWLLNRALDGLDGAVARAAGAASDLGGYLDLLVDFAVYAALPVALVLGRPADEAARLALIALLAACYVNAAAWLALGALLDRRRGAAARGTALHMPPGLVGGAETVLLYAAALLDPARAALWLGLMAVGVAASAVRQVAWAVARLPRAGDGA